MKKRSILLSLLLASAIILAACGTAQESTEYPAMTDEFGSPEVTEPVGTPEMTEPVSTPEMTEPVATQEVTEPAITPTIQATQPVTGTEGTEGTDVIPPTGFIDPARVSNLLDFGVWNQNDEQIGEVEDLVLNLGTAHVDYVIVDYDGKLVAVPCEALIVVSAKAQQAAPAAGPQNGFVLKIDQSQLDNAPEIDLDTIPELGEQAEGWDADIRSYWQGIVSITVTGTVTSTTTTEQTGLTGVVLASDLLGTKFETEGGEASMEVDDILVDVESCDIQYVVLSAGTILTGQKLYPLPVKVLSWDATNKVFITTVDPQVVLQAPTFEPDKYPPTITPNWDENLRSYWEKYIGPGN